MFLIPAVDLLSAQVVRLTKGDMDSYVVYDKDPVSVAKRFADMGVVRLHIVDLDGAKKGEAVNFNVIEKIASFGGLEMEVGGGIRDMARIEAYFNIGVKYAIIGTAVVKNKEFTRQALSKYPNRIILGLDARQGMVATDGWYETSALKATDLISEYSEYKAESVIYTDINKDGMLSGLNLAETVSFSKISPFPVIASGGVSSSADLDAIRKSTHSNIKGCIIGKAFYEGRINLEEELKNEI